MQIEPRVYLVGSGKLGFDLTDPYDCNIYLCDAGGEFVLFDAGAGLDVAQILAICHRDGIPHDRIRHLFLTHAHADHGGGAAHLRERLPLTVHATAVTARMVATADEQGVSLPAARHAGIYPADYVYHPCEVDEILAADSETVIGDLRILAIPTPGHSHDHTSYLVSGLEKRYLVGGDAIFFGGRIVLQHIYDCSVPDSIASIERLATHPFEALLPGHLAFSLQRGMRHVEAACAVIAQLGCPPALVV